MGLGRTASDHYDPTVIEYRATFASRPSQTMDFPDADAAIQWASGLVGPGRETVWLDKRVTNDPTVFPWERVGVFGKTVKA